jgi:hypothetical protein
MLLWGGALPPIPVWCLKTQDDPFPISDTLLVAEQ